MTVYRIARNPGDYKAAHDLMRGESFPEEKVGFPTILALDGGSVVGMLSTRIQNGMIIAGPMILKSDRRRIKTAIKLAELYEISMKGMGISTFIFNTETDSIVDKFIQRYSNMQPYATEGNQKFFIRRVA